MPRLKVVKEAYEKMLSEYEDEINELKTNYAKLMRNLRDTQGRLTRGAAFISNETFSNFEKKLFGNIIGQANIDKYFDLKSLPIISTINIKIVNNTTNQTYIEVREIYHFLSLSDKEQHISFKINSPGNIGLSLNGTKIKEITNNNNEEPIPVTCPSCDFWELSVIGACEFKVNKTYNPDELCYAKPILLGVYKNKIEVTVENDMDIKDVKILEKVPGGNNRELINFSKITKRKKFIFETDDIFEINKSYIDLFHSSQKNSNLLLKILFDRQNVPDENMCDHCDFCNQNSCK